jgi:hypothetical protein
LAATNAANNYIGRACALCGSASAYRSEDDSAGARAFSRCACAYTAERDRSCACAFGCRARADSGEDNVAFAGTFGRAPRRRLNQHPIARQQRTRVFRLDDDAVAWEQASGHANVAPNTSA